MIIVSGLTLALLAACAGEEPAADTTTTSQSAPTSTSTTTSRQPVTPSTTGPELGVYLDEETVDQVRGLAADDTGIPAADFTTEIAMQVTWNDGSLGCPQPGQGYTQALVDGYWVVLSHDGETYDYRSGMEQDFRACANGSPPISTYVDR